MNRVSKIIVCGFCLGVSLVATNADGIEPGDKPGYSPIPLARMGNLHLRHAGRIFHLSFSPDGKVLATAGQTGAVRLWNVKTGRLVRQIRTGGGAAGEVFFPPRGNEVMISCRSQRRADGTSVNTLCVYHLASGKQLRRFPLEGSTFLEIRFSNDGRIVAGPDDVQRTEKEFHFSVWDTKTGKRLIRREIKEKTTLFADLSPDGAMVCLKKKGGTLIMQETMSGKEICRLKGKKDSARAVAFSSDGKLLAATGNGVADVWDAKTGVLIVSLKIDPENPGTLLFGAGDKTIILDHGKEIGVWSIRSGKRLQRIRAVSTYWTRMTATADGCTLATCGSIEVTPRLWDIRTGMEITPKGFRGHRFSGGMLSFSPDGKKIVMIDGGSKGHIWEALTGKELGRLESKGFSNQVNMPVFIDNGRKILAGEYSGNMHEWDVATGTLLRTWPAFRVPDFLAVSPDEKTVAVANWRRRIAIWDISKGKLLKSFKVPEYRADPLCYTGRLLVAGCTEEQKKGDKYTHRGVVRMWDVIRDMEIGVWRGFKGHLFCLALSPDGRMVAAAGTEDCEYRLIEIATRKERGRIKPVSRFPYTADFSPDGRLLTLGTFDRLELWDVMTDKKLWQTKPLYWRCPHPVFSPTGRVLAASWTDGLIETWTLPSLPKANPLSASELNKSWKDLAGADAVKAWKAVRALALASKSTLSFLKNKVQPVRLTKVQQKQLNRWIADLNDARFRVRSKATAELRKAGELARPQLKNALKKKGLPLEGHQRLTQLLDQIESTPPNGTALQSFRALEVLEYIGSNEARKIALSVASSEPGLRITEEAKRSLRRWSQK